MYGIKSVPQKHEYSKKKVGRSKLLNENVQPLKSRTLIH